MEPDSVAKIGKVAINNDSKHLKQISNRINRPKITYGIKNKSDVTAEIISYNQS